MKKTICILMIMMLTFNMLAQDSISNVSKSNVGKLYKSSNVSLRKEFIKVDYIGNTSASMVKFEVLNIYNFKTKIKSSGVRVDIIDVDGLYTNSIKSRERISFLDKDELSDLITALKDFKSYIATAKDTNYVELTFRTLDDFEVSCFLDKIKQGDKAGASKNVKTYVDTKESMYEGKQVNKDEKGTYIWKTVTEASQGPTNKWKISISSGDIYKAQMFINIDKLDSLIQIFENCKKIIN